MFRIFSFVVLAAPKEKKSNTSAIVGGVIGGILFLVLIGVGIFLFLRWKSKYNFMLHSSEKVDKISKSIFENVTATGSATGFQQMRFAIW